MRAAVNFEHVAAFAYPDGKLIGLAQHGQVDVGSRPAADAFTGCTGQGLGLAGVPTLSGVPHRSFPTALRTREEIASLRFDKN